MQARGFWRLPPCGRSRLQLPDWPKAADVGAEQVGGYPGTAAVAPTQLESQPVTLNEHRSDQSKNGAGLHISFAAPFEVLG
jgi:hypothetical protein